MLIWRRAAVGYGTAIALPGIVVLLAPTIIGQTVSRLAGGVRLTTVVGAGPTVRFVALGAPAGWFTAGVLRTIGDAAPRTPERG